MTEIGLQINKKKMAYLINGSGRIGTPLGRKVNNSHKNTF